MPIGDLSGQTLGRYRVLSLLGRGGMGAVYCALDTSLERRVALKILPAEFAANENRLKRFGQEAKTASALNHPNLVSVYEIGSNVVDGETVHFIAMELVDGETLRERSANKSLDLRRTLQVLAQVADAVAAAHAVGITHRDLKPENIIIGSSGYAKVLDFGLAKLRREGAEDADAHTMVKGTDPGVVMGTVGYMAPEQAQGREADARSDVFSLGCILYELATGRRAFAGDSSVDTMHKIIHAQPERLVVSRPESPLELQRIVSKTLEKDPDERYQSVKDLAVDLRRLLRDIDSNPDLVTVSSGGHVALSKDRRRTPLLVVAGLVVVAVAAVAVTMWISRRYQAQPPREARAVVITRLTSLGKVIAATISPDAKLLAYVVADQGIQSFWLKQIATGRDLELIPSERVAYWSQAFSPDGNSIVFGVKSDRDPKGAFYEISILGGTPQKLVSGIDSPPTFSPDGKRIAWVRADFPAADQSALMVANRDGSGASVLATRTKPQRFAPTFYAGPSWSPDGSLIAVAENRSEGSVEARLIGVDPGSGRESVLSAGWQFAGQVVWRPDGKGIFAVAQRERSGSAQIWRIPREGEPEPVTNDLFDYRIVSLSADGKSLVTVASDAESSIWRAPVDGGEDPTRLTQQRLDGIVGVALLPDGGVVYPSLESGRIGLVRRPATSGQPSEITRSDNEARYPSVPGDGSFVVYLEMTPSGAELRRVSLDGDRVGLVLAKRIDGSPPKVTPDGKWILFCDDGILKRIPSGGGTAVPYTLPGPAQLPDISRDGRHVAFYYYLGEWRAGVVPLEGGEITWSREMAPPRYATALEWAPDGKGLLVNTMPRDRANIWLVPFEGEPKQITSLQDQNAGYFDVAADGRTLVYARFINIRDAVLITNLE